MSLRSLQIKDYIALRKQIADAIFGIPKEILVGAPSRLHEEDDARKIDLSGWQEIKTIDHINLPNKTIKPIPMTDLETMIPLKTLYELGILENPKKQPFGYGLFIRNDDSGNPCCIGDRVEVIRPKMIIENEDTLSGEIAIEETIFTGILVLLKSKGVRIKLDTGRGTEYIKPPITNRSRNIWKWRKL